MQAPIMYLQGHVRMRVRARVCGQLLTWWWAVPLRVPHRSAGVCVCRREEGWGQTAGPHPRISCPSCAESKEQALSSSPELQICARNLAPKPPSLPEPQVLHYKMGSSSSPGAYGEEMKGKQDCEP